MGQKKTSRVWLMSRQKLMEERIATLSEEQIWLDRQSLELKSLESYRNDYNNAIKISVFFCNFIF